MLVILSTIGTVFNVEVYGSKCSSFYSWDTERQVDPVTFSASAGVLTGVSYYTFKLCKAFCKRRPQKPFHSPIGDTGIVLRTFSLAFFKLIEQATFVFVALAIQNLGHSRVVSSPGTLSRFCFLSGPSRPS